MTKSDAGDAISGWALGMVLGILSAIAVFSTVMSVRVKTYTQSELVKQGVAHYSNDAEGNPKFLFNTGENK